MKPESVIKVLKASADQSWRVALAVHFATRFPENEQAGATDYLMDAFNRAHNEGLVDAADLLEGLVEGIENGEISKILGIAAKACRDLAELNRKTGVGG